MMYNDDAQQSAPPTIPGQQGAQQNRPGQQDLLKALLGRSLGAGGSYSDTPSTDGSFMGMGTAASQSPQGMPAGQPPLPGNAAGGFSASLPQFGISDGYTPQNGGGFAGFPPMQPGTSWQQLLQQANGQPGAAKQPLS